MISPHCVNTGIGTTHFRKKKTIKRATGKLDPYHTIACAIKDLLDFCANS